MTVRDWWNSNLYCMDVEGTMIIRTAVCSGRIFGTDGMDSHTKLHGRRTGMRGRLRWESG